MSCLKFTRDESLLVYRMKRFGFDCRKQDRFPSPDQRLWKTC